MRQARYNNVVLDVADGAVSSEDPSAACPCPEGMVVDVDILILRLDMEVYSKQMAIVCKLLTWHKTSIKFSHPGRQGMGLFQIFVATCLVPFAVGGNQHHHRHGNMYT